MVDEPPVVVLLFDPLLFVLTVFTTVAGFDPLFAWVAAAVTCGCWMTPLFTSATTVAPWSSVLVTGRMTWACESSV